MAKKKAARKTAARKNAARSTRAKTTVRKAAPKRRAATRRPSARAVSRLADVTGAERRDVGGVRLEIGRAGAARVKRMVYPAGFRWSKDMKNIVGTDYCM